MQAFVLRVCFEAHHVCYYLCVCVCLPQSSTFVSKAREQLFVCRLFVSKQQRARQKKRQTPLCNLAPPLSWLVSAAPECSGGRGSSSCRSCWGLDRYCEAHLPRGACSTIILLRVSFHLCWLGGFSDLLNLQWFLTCGSQRDRMMRFDKIISGEHVLQQCWTVEKDTWVWVELWWLFRADWIQFLCVDSSHL